jgi:hypothetical protein
MPPLPQRRNAAYLNRQNLAFRRAKPQPEWPGAATWTGLAIDLGGSVDKRFRPRDVGVA